MSEQTISPEIDTNIKSHIEVEFIDLSRNYIPTLRAFMTTPIPGNSVMVFNEFRKRFDALFVLSCNKKELKQETVEDVRKWINAKTLCTDADIREGIRLFEEYKAELFKHNVIKLG